MVVTLCSLMAGQLRHGSDRDDVCQLIRRAAKASGGCIWKFQKQVSRGVGPLLGAWRGRSGNAVPSPEYSRFSQALRVLVVRLRKLVDDQEPRKDPNEELFKVRLLLGAKVVTEDGGSVYVQVRLPSGGWAKDDILRWTFVYVKDGDKVYNVCIMQLRDFPSSSSSQGQGQGLQQQQQRVPLNVLKYAMRAVAATGTCASTPLNADGHPRALTDGDATVLACIFAGDSKRGLNWVLTNEMRKSFELALEAARSLRSQQK